MSIARYLSKFAGFVNSNGLLLPAGMVNGGLELGSRNRLHNGAFAIDQRNNGAQVSATGNVDVWPVDRTRFTLNGIGGTHTLQRSTDAPPGFASSLSATINSGSVSSGGYGLLIQHVEGSNFDDLSWGTSGAVPAIYSTWVKSSVAGNYSVFLRNLQAYNRYFVGNVSIPVANTWTPASVIIPGDVTGTWAGGVNGALQLGINLGCGSGYTAATMNAWAAGTQFATSSHVNMFSTPGTFKTTGWQLERGYNASPFEYRQHGTELNLCQRYCQVVVRGGQGGSGLARGDSYYFWMPTLQTPMRAVPSVVYTGTLNPTNFNSNYAAITGVVGVDYNLSNATTILVSFSTASSVALGAYALNANGNTVLLSAEM